MNDHDFFEEDDITKESEDDVCPTIKDFQDAVIWGTDWTTGTIVNQLNRGNIDLNPRFQRREAWTLKRKSMFIESLILGLPIPQIILAEKKDQKGKYIVIDGKQRLLSIRQFFSNPAVKNTFPTLYLSGLEALDTLNNKCFTDLSEDPSLQDNATAIENQSIRTIVIKNWPNEDFLYTVFLRINTGSLPLAPQELRQALHPGDFINFTDEFSINSEQIKKVLNIKSPDYRMRDVELVIRYFAFKRFYNKYNGNLKRFFDETVEELNKSWITDKVSIEFDAEQLNSAINFTYDIWGKDSFRKWKDNKFQGRFNRAVFDIMVFYFSQPCIRNEAIKKKNEIKDSFINLCTSNLSFLNSFETSTKNITPTSIRFNSWGEALGDILKMPIELPFMQK